VKKASRRGLSQEHVQANLRACEEKVRAFMDVAAAAAERRDVRGAVIQMLLGETSRAGSVGPPHPAPCALSPKPHALTPKP